MEALADRLNRECHCVSLDRTRLLEVLAATPAGPAIQSLVTERPNLFSDSPVFLARRWVDQMAEAIAALERVIALPAYQARVLQGRPDLGGATLHERGVFMGYDFHLGEAGPRLIEINTNAGGAYLNAAVGRAQIQCCAEVAPFLRAREAELDQLDGELVAMFRREYDLRFPGGELRSVAIVDEAPQSQYLYPEFLLAREAFNRAGIQAWIADPGELEFRGGVLLHGAHRIDLIYNRLTDFALNDPRNAALAAAAQAGAIALTPGPLHHALYADKSNLITLSDSEALRALGADETTIAALAKYVGRTVALTESNAEELWRERKRWFFKPTGGYGGKGAYRGDKLTTRVFAEIQKGGYIAQELSPPSERRVAADTSLKMDVRNYAYDGRVQLLAVRLYQGQTTNFRTPGGGFAPLFVAPELSDELAKLARLR